MATEDAMPLADAVSYRVARNGGLHDARPIIPGSGQRWKTEFKTPMIAAGGSANELHG